MGAAGVWGGGRDALLSAGPDGACPFPGTRLPGARAPESVAEILQDHVTFEPEAIDRIYLNAYVPSLQTGAGFVYFLKTQLHVPVASTVMVAPMSQRFVQALERFAHTEGVDLVTFERGERKDDVAQRYLATFEGDEGVLFIGKAQEVAHV